MRTEVAFAFGAFAILLVGIGLATPTGVAVPPASPTPPVAATASAPLPYAFPTTVYWSEDCKGGTSRTCLPSPQPSSNAIAFSCDACGPNGVSEAYELFSAANGYNTWNYTETNGPAWTNITSESGQPGTFYYRTIQGAEANITMEPFCLTYIPASLSFPHLTNGGFLGMTFASSYEEVGNGSNLYAIPVYYSFGSTPGIGTWGNGTAIELNSVSHTSGTGGVVVNSDICQISYDPSATKVIGTLGVRFGATTRVLVLTMNEFSTSFTNYTASAGLSSTSATPMFMAWDGEASEFLLFTGSTFYAFTSGSFVSYNVTGLTDFNSLTLGWVGTGNCGNPGFYSVLSVGVIFSGGACDGGKTTSWLLTGTTSGALNALNQSASYPGDRYVGSLSSENLTYGLSKALVIGGTNSTTATVYNDTWTGTTTAPPVVTPPSLSGYGILFGANIYLKEETTQTVTNDTIRFKSIGPTNTGCNGITTWPGHIDLSNPPSNTTIFGGGVGTGKVAFNLTPLYGGYFYCFEGATYASGGVSAWSTPALIIQTQFGLTCPNLGCATTTSSNSTKLTPPTNVHVYKEYTTSAIVNWTNPSEPLSGDVAFLGYYVDSTCVGYAAVAYLGVVGSYNYTGLNLTTTPYCVALEDFNTTVFSNLSAPAYILPLAPYDLTVLGQTTSSIAIGWANAPGYDILNVTVFYGTTCVFGGGWISSGAASVLQNVTGLKAGTRYCLTVADWFDVNGNDTQSAYAFPYVYDTTLSVPTNGSSGGGGGGSNGGTPVPNGVSGGGNGTASPSNRSVGGFPWWVIGVLVIMVGVVLLLFKRYSGFALVAVGAFIVLLTLPGV